MTWKSIIALLFLSLIMTKVNAVNLLIKNYTQLIKAIELGDNVRAIIHLDKCLLTDPNLREQVSQNLDGSTTRFNYTHYLHFKLRENGQLKDVVITSENHTIELATGDYLTVFGLLTVYEDNTAKLHIDLLDPVHQIKTFVGNWECDISNGEDDEGLMLLSGP